ncbi:GyrI-like domain-containing protein [Methanocella sp. MCL-LM]|uniref:GyrI-like domain-containing protein n=1 Tax=Methanocella sp. MCL-LM TaxID=3412035 RepID=UPI003C78B445
MPFTCEIKEMPVQQALTIRTRTSVQDLPQVVGQCFGSVAGYLGELGEQPAGAPFVAYYNMDMADLDVDIGFPVSKKFEGKGDIKPTAIPGGKTGTCFYTGPYQELASAYDALTKIVTEKGLEPTGIVYEMYYHSPMDTEPSKLQTLILFPLKS